MLPGLGERRHRAGRHRPSGEQRRSGGRRPAGRRLDSDDTQWIRIFDLNLLSTAPESLCPRVVPSFLVPAER